MIFREQKVKLLEGNRRKMIQRVETNSKISSIHVSSGIDKTNRDNVSDIPSIKDYLLNDDRVYNERNLHKISHIKIDNDDVVVYCHNINMVNSNDAMNGISTVMTEQLRIPKEEVKELIKQLLSEDS